MTTKGFVSLVGSGPGDPELLTLKAMRRIQQADVVVFDRLVSPEIMAMVPHGVSQISVGKSPGKHCVPQQQINEIIVDLALSGRRVVRLKGGDPYIFGRGGEEALALRQHGIPFEVVPGVTAASGCSSYSGIPLTHRGLNHGVRFITGHLHDDDSLDVDWRKLADPDCTLVIYMGLSNLQKISAELVRAGLPATTPAAAIHGGTTRHQRKVLATLSDLSRAVDDAGMRSPVTVIIGDVVSLSDQLDWFDSERATSAEVIAYDSFSLARA
ncbi:MAG: uroporphyrinogen-III C-methyltransferase [Gammaproteobacteria bacterium]|nr:uroporphyrinogen-III C-methyltransferase [Gammaproteobacteria bacterium]MDH3538211.1 uroporphyrinogen-III C-methyltransferase [Gammaproteobacteria bacterium]